MMNELDYRTAPRISSWDYLPLSDPVVVSSLIENRWAFDSGFECKEEWARDFYVPGSPSYHIHPEILLTYIDLDELISRSGLTEEQRKIVILMMLGYQVKDIA